MIKLSTGLKAALLTDYGLAALMEYGTIELYTGYQPASADDAATGTLLGRITHEGRVFVPGQKGAGLRLGRQALGLLTDDGNWVIRVRWGGEVGWWRWRWNADDTGGQSAYYPRVDGLAGDSLLLSDYVVAPGEARPIDSFTLTFEDQ